MTTTSVYHLLLYHLPLLLQAAPHQDIILLLMMPFTRVPPATDIRIAAMGVRLDVDLHPLPRPNKHHAKIRSVCTPHPDQITGQFSLLLARPALLPCNTQIRIALQRGSAPRRLPKGHTHRQIQPHRTGLVVRRPWVSSYAHLPPWPVKCSLGPSRPSQHLLRRFIPHASRVLGVRRRRAALALWARVRV